jgi:glyoxylase-like metal-dependent hydrolase (beta-lactamase superfamily II)
MKAVAHSQNLFQITRNAVFNCYLVREKNGLTLIDTMIPGSASLILRAAQSLDLQIERIVITHAHHDHVGSLDELSALLPGIEILSSAREARIMSGDHTPDITEPASELRGEFITCTTPMTGFLEPGDQIGALKVIPSSGHTPGHISFLDTRDGSLIAGDAYANLFELIVSGVFTPLFPISSKVTWHKPQALESAKRLRDLQPSRMAFGHGGVLEKPLNAMTRAINKAELNDQFLGKPHSN